MFDCTEITTQVERKVIFPDRHVELPRLTQAPPGSEEWKRWTEKNWWMVDYSVFYTNKEEAKRLALELDQAYRRSVNDPLIPSIIEKLKALKTKDYCDMTPLEIWTRSAYQVVNYSGGLEADLAIRKKLGHYHGNILEAMCGQTSYFLDGPNRIVTALDYCKESLERYPYPKRRRILCDLNQVKEKTMLTIFQEAEFDVISICFGFKYPKHIVPLLREFRRILKPNGVLSFIENPYSSYAQCQRRKFSPKCMTDLLSRSEYQHVKIETLHVPYHDNEQQGAYYHVQAVK